MVWLLIGRDPKTHKPVGTRFFNGAEGEDWTDYYTITIDKIDWLRNPAEVLRPLVQRALGLPAASGGLFLDLTERIPQKKRSRPSSGARSPAVSSIGACESGCERRSESTPGTVLSSPVSGR